MCFAATLGLGPGVSLADPVRFKTPGLTPSAIELPAHDSVLLVVEGWSADRFEASILQAWRDPKRGDEGGSSLGLEWTGQDERSVVTDPANAGASPLRIEVTVSEPIAHDKWDTQKKKKAQYGPVAVKDIFYKLVRTTELRVDLVVRGPDGETVHAATEFAKTTEAGDWEPKEEDAEAHANSADAMAMGLIDDLASKLLDGLQVTAKPRSFAMEKNKECKKEIAGCLEAIEMLKKSDDLVSAYEAMAAIDDGDAWVSYNAAVLAAALRRYDAARGHLEEAKALDDNKRFDKLALLIRDWEADDRRLVEGGYPLQPPE